MANVAAPMQKALLDWSLGGAAATQPTSRLAGLSLGVPTSVNGSEVQPGSGYARQTALFGPAASPAGSAANIQPMTFGPFSSSAAIQGLVLYDAITGGNLVWFGTLLTAKTVNTGDLLVLEVGSLIITLT